MKEGSPHLVVNTLYMRGGREGGEGRRGGRGRDGGKEEVNGSFAEGVLRNRTCEAPNVTDSNLHLHKHNYCHNKHKVTISTPSPAHCHNKHTLTTSTLTITLLRVLILTFGCSIDRFQCDVDWSLSQTQHGDTHRDMSRILQHTIACGGWLDTHN